MVTWLAGSAGVFVVLVLIAVGLAALGVGGGRLSLAVDRPEAFVGTVDLPTLGVDGADVVAGGARAVTLRGIMPPDPAVLDADGRLTADLFEEIAATGANVVRIPVHPQHWQDHDDYLWRYLDPAVRWAGDAGMYAIIDWHAIGDIRTGEAPLHPDLYVPTEALAHEFWTATAAYFAGAPHVLFEVFNEPQGIAARDWREAAQRLVDVIRSSGARQPAIVGGTSYARDLSWVLDDPVDDPAVIYAAHIYPSHGESAWPRYFGDVAARHPVVLTEWGFASSPPGDGLGYLVGSESGYGRALVDYADAVGAGWVACWWDGTWQPAMLEPGTAAPNQFGRFVIDELSRP